MNSVKNNKEYSALLIEVNTIKVEKAKVEEQALEQMGKVEAVAGESQQVAGKAAAQEKLLTVAAGEVESCRAQIGTQLAELTKRRDAAAAEVPGDALTTFERSAKVHDGEAMAPVIEESRRHLEYSCGGCYMSIPVEQVNALTKEVTQLVCCTNCGRILFLEEELKSSMGINK
jgi:predicted  nucleic acid-binding Zn-ribbon protein